MTVEAPERRLVQTSLQLRDTQLVGKPFKFLEGRAVPYDTWANIGWFLEAHQPGSLDETTTVQKLAAEALGTAFLVFIGVGSVPATLIVNGDAPFTMADLGMISLAFGTIVIATVYALGHVGGNHINPAVTLGLAVSGKFPWSQVPAYIAAQVVGAIVGASAIIGVLGHKASDVGLGVASYSGISWVQAFTAEFVGTFALMITTGL